MTDLSKTIFISGPDPQLKLIYSDVWLPGLYSRRILCFALPPDSSHEQAIETVERALKALVQGTPELGGLSVVVPPEQEGGTPWRAIVPHKGLEVVIKDLRASFMSFKELEAANFPVTAFPDQVLLPIAPAIEPEPKAVCKIQLNLIEGGILMGFCAYHHLTDGNGMNSITLAFGEECKRAATTSGDLPPRVLNTDRSVMASITGSKKDLAHHPAYSMMPGVWRPHLPGEPDPHAEEAPTENGAAPELLIRQYRLDHDKAKALKASASTLGPVSTHDAVAALMWRTLIKARLKLGRLEDSKVTTWTFPVNARKYVGLDKNWIGNCVYFGIASVPAGEVVRDDSLPKIASAIRADINRIDKDLVGSIFEFRRPQTYDVAWWPFVIINNPEIIGTTSFYRSDLYTDFGPALGKVRHFSTTDAGAVGGFGRAQYIGAKLPGGSGVDLAMGMDTEEYEIIKKDELFHKYFRLLGHE